MEFCEPPPSRVISIVWGFSNIKKYVLLATGVDPGEYTHTDLPGSAQRVAQLEKDGEMDGTNLGDGGNHWFGTKTLQVYYRDQHGRVGMAACREGGTVRLPWNPLAKWSCSAMEVASTSASCSVCHSHPRYTKRGRSVG